MRNAIAVSSAIREGTCGRSITFVPNWGGTTKVGIVVVGTCGGTVVVGTVLGTVDGVGTVSSEVAGASVVVVGTTVS